MMRLSYYFMTAYLVMCPIIFTANQSNDRAFQEHFWHYAAMFVLVTLSRNIWMVAFFALNAALVWMNGFKVGEEQLFNIFLAIMIFVAARHFFKRNEFIRFIKPLFIVGILSILWMGLQLLGWDPMFSPMDNKGQTVWDSPLNNPIGLFGLKAHHAIFFATLMPLAAATFTLPVSLALLPIIWLQESSGAMLAALCGMLFYVFYLYRRWFVPTLVILGILGGIYIAHKDYNASPAMFKSRVYLWHMTTKLGLDRWWSGYGPGSYAKRARYKDFMFLGDENFNPYIGFHTGTNPETGAEQYAAKKYDPNFFLLRTENKSVMLESPNQWSNAHNLLFQLFFEQGVIGLILFFGLLTDLIKRFKHTLASKELICITSCIIVYLVSSTTQFPLYVARLGYLFPVLLGAFYSLTEGSHDI